MVGSLGMHHVCVAPASSAHHMFTVGMTSVSNAFFTLSTMLVGVPTGIKIFNLDSLRYLGRSNTFFDNANALLHRIPLSIPDRGIDRHYALGILVGLATP